MGCVFGAGAGRLCAAQSRTADQLTVEIGDKADGRATLRVAAGGLLTQPVGAFGVDEGDSNVHVRASAPTSSRRQPRAALRRGLRAPAVRPERIVRSIPRRPQPGSWSRPAWRAASVGNSRWQTNYGCGPRTEPTAAGSAPGRDVPPLGPHQPLNKRLQL